MGNFGYIYKTVNTTNNKVYIGQSKGQFKQNYFGSGLYISRAIKRHGQEKFKVSIIAYADNKKQLDDLEKRFISEYRDIFGKRNLYNLANGGQGGDIGFSLKGEKHPNWGKKFSADLKRKLSIARRNRVTKQETRDKLSKSISGMNNPFYGKHHSAESINKNRIAHLGGIPWNKRKRGLQVAWNKGLSN